MPLQEWGRKGWQVWSALHDPQASSQHHGSGCQSPKRTSQDLAVTLILMPRAPLSPGTPLPLPAAPCPFSTPFPCAELGRSQPWQPVLLQLSPH